MRVAVTGATGFVGRYVVQELSRREGLSIVAASRSAPAEGALPQGCRHVRLDLCEPSASPFELLGSPDVLIHLAWDGLPNFISVRHFETHLFEQLRFVKSVADGGLSSILCAGTCFEYGMRCGELDEAIVTDPQNPYGFAKDAMRKAIEFLSRDMRFAVTWARLFYMYGEGQAPTSIYSQLMEAGRSGRRSFKMSAGEQLRDFLPVERVAEAIVSLALHAPGSGVVNVCSGEPVSVRSMVERWIQAQNWSMELDLGRFPYPKYEPLAFWGSRRKLDGILARCAPNASDTKGLKS